MDNLKDCKGCSASVIVSQKQIDNLIDDIVKSGQFCLVNNSVYKIRLDKCNNCKYLQYGTTCLQCGCIVQIKAKIADSVCPYPKNSKW